MSLETLVVSDSGTVLSYIDSGAPSKSPYITIFAIHGMCFSSRIFKKVQRIFLENGVRFVALNRRGFPGSSPLTSDEMAVVTGGSDEQKTEWMALRGKEIATFIDTFSQKFELPSISDDGKSGGIALLGWSVGASLAVAMVSILDTLPAEVRTRFASQLRALIIHEVGPIAFGLPSPPKNYASLTEQSIPAEFRLTVFAHWLTSYFEHGDLSKRDLDSLSYVVPSTIRPPSIFNMSKAEIAEIVSYGEEAATDLPFLFFCGPQLKACYHKSFYDPATAKLLPKMRISYIAGDLSPAWGPAGMWAIQDDDKVLGRGQIDFKLVRGVNHFMQWDDPEKTVEVYTQCLNL